MRVGVAGGWCLSRLLVVMLLFYFEGARGVGGDLEYFAHNLQRLSTHGWGVTMPEYPVPAVALLGAASLLAGALGWAAGFPALLILGLLATDGWFTRVLAKRAGPGRRDALVLWLVGGPVVGGLFLARFDLVVGVVVALTLLTAVQRPRVSSALLAVAVGLKLWPVVLLPSLLASTRRRRPAVVAFAITGAVLAVATLALAGVGRTLSPLVYQAHRGLQIEALTATPVMIARLSDPGRWPVRYSSFKAYEVFGPGVAGLLSLTTVLTLALFAVLGCLWYRAWRGAGPASPEVLVWLTLASVTGWWVSSKVFSPQYLLWALPVAAAGLVLTDSAALRRWCGGLLVACGCTHLIYPWLYRGLIHAGELSWLTVCLLVMRNSLVLLLFLHAVVNAWRLTRRVERAPVLAHSEASRPDRVV